MGAFYYKYAGGDLYGADIGGSALPFSCTLASLNPETLGTNLGIITSITGRTTESMQFFLSFDDVIHYLHFGKGVGEVNVRGMVFPDCEGKFKGISEIFKESISARAKLIAVTLNNIVFTGPLTAIELGMTEENGTMLMTFSISVSVVLTE